MGTSGQPLLAHMDHLSVNQLSSIIRLMLYVCVLRFIMCFTMKREVVGPKLAHSWSMGAVTL